jgi:hypothetical protein
MFDNLLRELRALERRSITVPIDSDEKGYIDKECPSTNCEFQFKIKDEDWKNICRDEGVWCPMCGHAAPAKSWFTKAQVQHAERHAHRVIESTIDGAMRADARAFNAAQGSSGCVGSNGARDRVREVQLPVRGDWLGLLLPGVRPQLRGSHVR